MPASTTSAGVPTEPAGIALPSITSLALVSRTCAERLRKSTSVQIADMQNKPVFKHKTADLHSSNAVGDSFRLERCLRHTSELLTFYSPCHA